MIVYKITNKITGKAYIGQTARSLEERWQEHCSPKSRCRAIKDAIYKYGKDNFDLEILIKYESIEELNKIEVQLINDYKTLVPNGYNLNTGGNSKIPSKETRQRMALAKIGKPGNNTSGLQNKTHCIHGHEFTIENTYIRAARPKYKRCRTCHKLNMRKLQNYKGDSCEATQ